MYTNTNTIISDTIKLETQTKLFDVVDDDFVADGIFIKNSKFLTRAEVTEIRLKAISAYLAVSNGLNLLQKIPVRRER